MTKIKATGADGIYIGGVSTNNGGQLVKDKVPIVGNNDTVKLLVSDGFVLSSLFDEAGADNVNGVFGTAPTQPPEKLTGEGKKFINDFGGRGRQAARGLHGLRRRSRAGAARRDQPLGRQPVRHPREDVRDRPARLGRRRR